EKANHLEIASVSFRDIDASAGFSLNPSEQFNPASLIKVPTMMAYFNLAQRNPGILSQKITYDGLKNANTQEHFVSQTQLIPGNTYTVEELIEHMIKYSDNNAGTMLIDYLNDKGNENALNQLFKDLGLNTIDLGDDYITMSGFTLF